MDETRPGMQVLKGKWYRPDGGYIIHIKSIDADGTMEAAYFNPNPVPVSKAEAVREGETVKVFMELTGAGYSGSTYSLTYEPATDRLAGIYFQAQMVQRFQVFFMRVE
jgi:uncharacterized protein (DUF2147 family)